MPRKARRKRPRTLSVCPETLSGITKLSQHEADGGEAQEGKPLAIEVLPILGQPATPVEPRNRALNNPPLGHHYKALGGVRALDNGEFKPRPDLAQRRAKGRPLIGPVGKQLLQERILLEQDRQQQNAPVAILNVGRMNEGLEQQTQRVYENMALLALDLLARIIAMRINAGPPFSALFTL
jgi:hypothetical protein